MACGPRTWRNCKTDDETNCVLGFNWCEQKSLKFARVSTEFLGCRQDLPSQLLSKRYEWAFDGKDHPFTYKFYNNNDVWLGYIFKDTVRVDWAVEFRFLGGYLVFNRLVILNRILTNMYLDFLYNTFNRQRHKRVTHRITAFQLVAPCGKQDKAQTLIAKSVGFKKESMMSYILQF